MVGSSVVTERSLKTSGGVSNPYASVVVGGAEDGSSIWGDGSVSMGSEDTTAMIDVKLEEIAHSCGPTGADHDGISR